MRDKRQIRTVPCAYRAEEREGGKYIEGYFSVFGSVYELWDGAMESVDPGALDGALDDDIRCLIDHETRLVLGRTTAGTLELKVDERGLWGRVKINEEDTDAMNLYARVKRGDVSQCSFGFEILDERVEYGEDGSVHFIILRVKLYEVSVVTFPAYRDTEVSARKQEYTEIKKRQIENWRANMLRRLKKHGAQTDETAPSA